MSSFGRTDGELHMQDQNDITSINISLNELHAKIALGDLLIKLENTRGFKKLISTDYFETKAQGLVSMIGLPTSDAQKEILMNSMHGISSLQSYLRSIRADATAARASLAGHEAELELAMNEEV